MTGVDQALRMAEPLRVVRRPLVVELVGPAAAGKSTLLRMLGGRDRSLRAGLRPARHQHLRSAVALVPTFLALHRGAGGVLWKEMKRITYLRTLHRILVGTARSPRPVLLDEGPVYMLARLRMYGGDRMGSPAFQQWWRSAFEQWARTLDLVVWLDAPDAVLIDRIRTRSQRHRMQEVADSSILQFLTSYRQAYTEVIAGLTAPLHLRVLSFRTDQEPATRIAEQVGAAIGEGEPGP
ncbi:MAG: AAA family ATPase [Gemmatimonadales bacterium]